MFVVKEEPRSDDELETLVEHNGTNEACEGGDIVEEHILMEFPEYDGRDLLAECKKYTLIVRSLFLTLLFCFT